MRGREQGGLCPPCRELGGVTQPGADMYEVGTQPWLDALRAAVNEGTELAGAARGWSVRLGLSFEPDTGAPRHVALDIEDGKCVNAIEDDGAYDSADVRIAGPCQMWATVFEGAIEPIRSIVTNRLRVDGNQLLLVRAMPTAKALIEAAKKIEARFEPVA